MPRFALIGLLSLSMASAAMAGDDDDLCPLVQASTGRALGARVGTALGFRPAARPPQVVQDLEDYTGLPPNFYVLWPTQDARVRENAASQFCEGQPYIFYDDAFFGSIPASEGGKDWTKYFIFAHETGHHQLNHFAGPAKERRQKELEADEWAGYALERMNIPISALILAVDYIQPSYQDTDKYPGRCKRRQAALDGFNRAARQTGSKVWLYCECWVVPLEKALYARQHINAQAPVTNDRVLACGNAIDATDHPTAFDRDIAGFCAEKALDVGEMLTWNNVGVCAR
jgi:hypothetical protein